jgi:hypothetical protein
MGDDGVWVSRLDVLRPDQTWLTTVEFGMKRVQ